MILLPGEKTSGKIWILGTADEVRNPSGQTVMKVANEPHTIIDINWNLPRWSSRAVGPSSPDGSWCTTTGSQVNTRAFQPPWRSRPSPRPDLSGRSCHEAPLWTWLDIHTEWDTMIRLTRADNNILGPGLEISPKSSSEKRCQKVLKLKQFYFSQSDKAVVLLQGGFPREPIQMLLTFTAWI